MGYQVPPPWGDVPGYRPPVHFDNGPRFEPSRGWRWFGIMGLAAAVLLVLRGCW